MELMKKYFKSTLAILSLVMITLGDVTQVITTLYETLKL